MKITRVSEMDTAPASADYFTGHVSTTLLRNPEGLGGPAALRVRFAPGARTAWHTHPHGQLLIVTEGEGWAQSDGQPKQVINPGDAIWFAPGERHWHGASATSEMEHIAIQQPEDGQSADWAEQVTEDDYLG